MTSHLTLVRGFPFIVLVKLAWKISVHESNVILQWSICLFAAEMQPFQLCLVESPFMSRVTSLPESSDKCTN